MPLYAFASDTVTNIWAGIGAGVWAVAPVEESPYAKGRRTKALKMPIGAFGILYSSADRALTTPFVVCSKVQIEGQEDRVWLHRWVMPFQIKPLGSPRKMLTIDRAKEILPCLNADPQPRFDSVFRVRGDFAFQTSPITTADWEILIQELAI